MTYKNPAFAEYATSVAFSIHLSKNMCNHLLRMDSLIEAQGNDDCIGVIYLATSRALQSRGLVEWQRNDQGRTTGYRVLTPAGKLMVALLKEAGITLENTVTPTSERWAA